MSKARTLVLSIAFMWAVAAVGAAKMTIIWSNFGGVPMNHADAAWAYCQPRDPEATYPQEGNPLTACEEEWWNDGDPLPSGGG